MDRYQQTWNTWNKLAKLYEDKFMDIDLYNQTYDMFCQYITQTNSGILEIGCGPGNITRYLLGKRPDFDITAIDVAPNMIELASRNNPTVNCMVMDCRNIDTIANYFNGIVCGFCLPYLDKQDGSKLIKDCSNLLNKGGYLYFSTIEGDYTASGYQTASTDDQTFVYYYDETFLRQVLIENGFDLLQLSKINYPKNGGKSEAHLVLIACKK
jgi:2-polyprenyl-3-methyl-5-hydroxy-6-metoxy-1,4-benzoquinol methylase